MSEYDYFSGDVKRLWRDQIAGIIDFDHGDFIGALSDLQGDPEWKSAFAEIESDAGMADFFDRTQKHFDLCQAPPNADGSVYAYQHPSRTKSSGGEKDQGAMVRLMQRYLETVATAVQGEYPEDAVVVRNLNVVWTDDWDLVDDDGYARDGAPAKISLYEAMSEIEDVSEKKGAPKIMSEIREACYGLSACYDLQRYLMKGFHTHEYDLEAWYELEWMNGCSSYFDETTCYVYDHAGWSAARRAAKEAEKQAEKRPPDESA